MSKNNQPAFRYKLILFDADGTLFDYDQAESFAIASTFKHFGLIYDEAAYLSKYREINSRLWQDLEAGKTSFSVLRLERFRRLFAGSGLEINLEEFSNAYLSCLGKGVYLIDGAEEICAHLAHRYTMAVITNGNKEVQLSRFMSSPLGKYFKNIIASEEAGFQKPNPRIFEYAFQVTGHIDKDTALMIGDSLSTDIRGGINSGIDTCWFNPAGVENRAGIAPLYEIRRLVELKNWL